MKYTINSSAANSKSGSNRFSVVTGRTTPRKSIRPNVARASSASGSTSRVKPRDWSPTKKSGMSKFKVASLFSKKSNRKGASTNKSGPKTPDGRKRAIKKKVLKVFYGFMIFGFFAALVGAISLGLYLQNLERSLPDPDKLISYKSEESTILYDRNGTELYKFYDEFNREFVSIDKIPEHTQMALLAAEDINFETHEGLDWSGIIRCSFLSLQSYVSGGSSGVKCGASTISQQLVRNTIMYEVFGDEAFERDNLFKTARRKLREMLLTMQVEQNFKKEEILQLYMNEVPLGGVNYGFQAASKAYFGKDVSELTLAESAIISGIIQQPSTCAPVIGTDPDCAKSRQDYVFGQLEKYTEITDIDKKEIEAAKKEEIVYTPAKIDIKAPHFVFYIREQLEKEFGTDKVTRGGLRVTTSIDLPTQEIAQEEVTNGTARYGNPRGIFNGSLIALDPKTNQLIAMVGSVDYNNEDPRIDGEVNVSTNLRQMGSSVKPYVYTAAFEKYGPYLTMPDVPQIKFANYNPQPRNWDDRYMGLLDMRKALVESRNIPAIYTLELIGIPAGIEMMQRVGITAFDQPADNYGLSISLGSKEMKLLEHTGGYSVFATGGIKRDITSILKVTDSRGEILKEYKDSEGTRVIKETDAYMTNWALCDIGGYGDAASPIRSLKIGGIQVCSKTGTTDGPTDILAMMYHKNLVVGMWNGNNDNSTFPGAFGSTVSIPIAMGFIERVAGKYPVETFERPAGVVAVTVCRETGRTPPAGIDCPKVSTVSDASRLPQADKRSIVKICKANGKIADNAAEIEQYNPDLLESKFVLDFELENKAHQDQYAEYLTSQGAPAGTTGYLLKKPETARCDLPLGPGGAPVIQITSPGANATLNAGTSVTIKANAAAQGRVQNVEFYFDDTMINRDNEAGYEFNYTIPANTANGAHQIKAKVTDDQNRSTTATITVTIAGGQSNETLNVNITSPTNGQNSSLPMTITANVGGGVPSYVRFKITRVSGEVSTGVANILDNNPDGGWSVTWNGPALPGQYSIVAEAFKGGQTYTSPTITVNLN